MNYINTNVLKDKNSQTFLIRKYLIQKPLYFKFVLIPLENLHISRKIKKLIRNAFR